jgi:hypothetical protein
MDEMLMVLLGYFTYFATTVDIRSTELIKN